MTDFFKRYALPIVLAVSFGFGLLLGWFPTFLYYRGDVAQMKADAERAKTAQERALREALENLRAREEAGNKLAQKLLEAETANRTLTQEKNDAIQKLATGRRCLDADLVGLLNQSANAGSGVRLPAHTGITADPDAPFATDADVGRWANEARSQYDACRERIAAIRQITESQEEHPTNE